MLCSKRSHSLMHCLNTVFATLTHCESERYRQLQHVLDFLYPKWNELVDSEQAIAELAERLLRLHEPDKTRLYLEHCHFSAEMGGLLWLREVLLCKLRSMAVVTQGILLISGLEKVFKSPTGRWTLKRKAAYLEARAFCEGLVQMWSPSPLQRHIIFVEL